MSIVLPPTRPIPYGPPPRLGVQPDGTGYTATCKCLWLKWTPDQKTAATDYAKHVKSCKAHAEVAA